MYDPEAQYEFVRKLGHGGMALVELWRRCNADRGLVVAKLVHVGEMTQEEKTEARQEAKVLRRLKHPNIVRYVESWVNNRNDELVIVQEYYDGGDMSQLIKKARDDGAPLRTARVLRWVAQLVHAMLYCHGTWKMLHRDLKPQNIFLSSGQNDVHIGDFGIARALGSTKSFCHTFIGTAAYMSPEVIRQHPYSFKSDVWGLGAVLYEICALKRPFEGPKGNPVAAMQLIVAPGPAPKFPPDSQHPPDLERLCTAMLAKTPRDRPTLAELCLGHPVLRKQLLQFEQELKWEDSLVPPLVEIARPVGAPDLACLDELVSTWCSAPPPSISTAPPNPRDPPPPPPLSQSPSPKMQVCPPSPSPGDRGSIASMFGMPMGPAGAAEGAGAPAQDTPPAAAASLREAAGITGLLELTVRKDILEAFLDTLWEESRSSASSPLAAQPPPLPPPAPGNPASGCLSGLGHGTSEFDAWAQDLTVAAGGLPSCGALERRALHAEAEAVQARLACIDVLQAPEPNPEELTLALRDVQKFVLDKEECGQALQVHVFGLRLQAEDAVARADANLAEVEKATQLLEVLAQECSGLQGMSAPEHATLELANKRLDSERQRSRQLGLRTRCEGVVRLLSVPADAGFTDVELRIAEAWARKAENLHLTWRERLPDQSSGTRVSVLDSQESWERCVQGHSEGSIELTLRALQAPAGAAARRRRKQPQPARKAPMLGVFSRLSEPRKKHDSSPSSPASPSLLPASDKPMWVK